MLGVLFPKSRNCVCIFDIKIAIDVWDNQFNLTRHLSSNEA